MNDPYDLQSLSLAIRVLNVYGVNIYNSLMTLGILAHILVHF